MSKFGLFALVIALLTSIASCDKSEDPDVYYVKYKVYENAENLEIEHVSVNTENGIQRLYGDSDFEVIVGPVEKGFETSMVGSAQVNHYKAACPPPTPSANDALQAKLHYEVDF